MNSLQGLWNLHDEQLAWNGCDEAIGTPTYASASDSDGSKSESDGDLLSLFEQPEPNYSKKERIDRGGRPFPYTRSKTRWRKRPNDEIKYLRWQIVELEKVKAELSKTDVTPTAGGGKQTEALRKFREENHSKILNAALAENRKLQAMVEARFQVTKALQTTIDEDVRLRAQKVYCPDGAMASNDLVFAFLDEEREHQHAAISKIMV